MISTLTARRLEIWDKPKCAGGVRKAIITNAQRAVASAQLGADGAFTLVVPALEPCLSEVLKHRVLRVDESDASFDEWRISDIQTDADAGTVTVIAAPCFTFLGRRALCAQVDGLGVRRHDFDVVSLAPSAIIDTIILPALSAAGLTWVSRGTINNDAPIDVTVSWDSPWALLVKVAAQAGLELQLTRNGTVGYTIDLLTAIGSAAAVSDVRFGKNLLKSSLRRATDAQATRVFPRGASADGQHATLARAAWKVTNVVGNVVTLADPAGNDGPIAFDSQLVGMYLRRVDGTLTQVTASSAAAQTVTVASAAGIAATDLVQFRADATGNDLTWLDSPSDQADDVTGVLVGTLDVSDAPATANVIPNPALRDWPGTLPTGWTAIGAPAFAKQTVAPYLQTAGQSLHVTAAVAELGVLSPMGRVYPNAGAPFGSGFASLWVVSGMVRVEAVITLGVGGTKTIPLAPALATNSVRGQWEALGLSGIDLNALGATGVQIKVVSHGGAAEFYLDAGQWSETAAQQPFIEGSGGVRLWQAANDQLRLYAGAAIVHQLTAVDLVRLGLNEAPLVLGGRVRITDARVVGSLAAYTTRIVQLERDYLVVGNTSLALSTRPDDLQGVLARPAKRPKLPTVTTTDHRGTDTKPTLVVDPVLAATQVTINYTTNVTTAADLWYTLDNGAPLALPATGFVIARNVAGGGTKNATLHARLNGQEIAVPVQIPAQDAGAPWCNIVEAVASRTKPTARLIFSGGLGAGATGALSWRYTVAGGTPSAWSTATLTGTALTVTRDPFYPIDVLLEVLQADGQPASCPYVVAGRADALDSSTGKMDRAVPMAGGGYSAAATDTNGYNLDANATDSTLRAQSIRRTFAKPSYTDSDDADHLPDGPARRVPLLAHLDAAGTLRSAVGPDAQIADQYASSVAKRAGSSYFAETFDSNPATNGWTAGGVVATAAASGATTMGKKLAWWNGGYGTLNLTRLLPFNPNKLYRIRARVLTQTANTTGSSLWYLGLVQYDSAGAVIANGNAGVAYVAAAGANPAAGSWQEYVGWYRGASLALASYPASPSTDPTAPTALNVGCAQVAPLIYAGYSGSGGQFFMDYLLIDEFDEDGSMRTYSAIDAYNGSYGRTLATTRDSTLRALNRALAKTNYTDGDSLDYVPDGPSYKRVLGVNGSGLITPSSSSGRNRARVRNGTAINVNTASTTTIAFDTEDYKVGVGHSNVSTPSRVIIPAGGNVGVWQLVAQVSFDGQSTGSAGLVRDAKIVKNGLTGIGEVLIPPIPASALLWPTALLVSAFDDAPAVGDYYEVQVYHDSSAATLGVRVTFFITHLW